MKIGKLKLTPPMMALLLITILASLGAAATLISNTLHSTTQLLGPQPQAQPIVLTQNGSLPSQTYSNTAYSWMIRTRNIDANYSYNNLQTRFKISAGTTLTASMVTLNYKGAVTLVWNATSQALEGSYGPWNAIIGFDDNSTITVTFNSTAPVATYNVDVWVEGP